MKLMSEKDKVNWEKTRAKGFNRYVVKWTLLFGILLPFLQLTVDRVFDGTTNTRVIFLNFILFLIFGFLFGWWTYEWNEYKYKKTIGKHD